MKYNVTVAAIVLFISLANVKGQNTPPKQSQEKTEDRVVVTTNLVQVDAVVTDKSGKPVTNLAPDDFEILEGGRVRQITGFSYIQLNSKESEAGSIDRQSYNANVTAVPPKLHAIRPESVRRAIAIVVDDFGLSFESIARLRDALEKFILEETAPSDLIAIIRTSSGPGARQQFTSNRAQILATIKRLRWYPTGRGAMATLDSIGPLDNDGNGVELRGYSANRPPDLSSKEFHGGSLGALAFIIDGLSRFPGRKSLVLISENLPVTTREAQINGVAAALDKLIEHANRYSIVISTMDARGLPKAGLTSDDNQYDLAANQIEKRVRERRIKFNVDQDALSYIAAQTGGMFVRNSNDLNEGLRRIIESEQGYYLLAYRPDDSEKAGNDRTYKVTLRLKRLDLVLRNRSRFHRFTKTSETNVVKTKDDFLREALASPFVREDVRLKVTALATGASHVKVFLHIDARDLELTKSADGMHKATFDVAAVAFDDNGKVGQQLARNQNVAISPNSYERFLRDGLVYTIDMSIPRAGPYQVRVAIRDEVSGRLGSDSQFVDVPDPRKSRLTVAGLIMQAQDATVASKQVGARSDHSAAGLNNEDVRKAPAVRRFKSGELFEYSYLIYGARLNATTGRDLWSQIRLFRHSQEVFTGDLTRTVVAKDLTHEAIVSGGTLRLGNS